jgi:acyl dehydratase
MADRYFYDFKIGERFESASLEVSESDIIAFASSYDPQPWHLDHNAAAASPFKGLVASGWHTAAITMRLVVESSVLKATGVLGTGIDELRWIRPVRPGAILHVTGEIVGLEPPHNGRSAGTMRVRLETADQRGEIVMSAIAILRIPVRSRNA